MDETVLGDEINDAVLLRNLEGNREIVGGFWREENIDGLLGKYGVRLRVVDLDNV